MGRGPDAALRGLRLLARPTTAGRRRRGLFGVGQTSPSPALGARSGLRFASPSQKIAQTELPPTFLHRDAVGAVSLFRGTGPNPKSRTYKNADGHRIDDGRYAAFAADISEFIPLTRQFTDPVRTFAYGTDASFYRLNPKLVVKCLNETEIARILPIARRHEVPVTFRAAGTSLSGQAITDSVLLKINHVGENFRNAVVHGDGSAITLGPGIIGGEANAILARHQRKHGHEQQYKIGPDPASIDSAMIGGIVANNASGMCCGVAQNSYHTVRDMRVVLADGSVLDTSDPASVEAFLTSPSTRPLALGLEELARRVQADRKLTNLIRRKFAIKNTTGYSLNALVDFAPDDVVEIIKHLMVGSEGTLGFVSSVTYSTVPEVAHKASAFIMFPTVHAACRVVALLRETTAVDAVELFDRASLRDFEGKQAMVDLVPDVVGAGPQAAALLIQCLGATQEALDERVAEVEAALRGSGTPVGARDDEQTRATAKLSDYPFHRDGSVAKVFWDLRKGLVPLVGGAREPGTTMFIEDIACPIANLADMTVDIIDMFERFGYKDSYTFGHALEGNLHVVFSQGFRNEAEVQRFADLMDEMARIVATKHAGSLKGEHGTGRNMAPYVEMEWGRKASDVMWELKALFDPAAILNPGVVLNHDPLAHVHHIKSVPPASPIVDRCIECGFCESNCPSRDITLSPRQRIAVFKEIKRLEGIDAGGLRGAGAAGAAAGAAPGLSSEERLRLDGMRAAYEYDGKDTCAADGMCEMKCPVKINTGELIKHIREEDMSANHPRAVRVADGIADNFAATVAVMTRLLQAVGWAHRLLGPKPLELISTALNRASGHVVPVWNEYLPREAKPLRKGSSAPPAADPTAPVAAAPRGVPRKVVYFPTCVTRIMGPSAKEDTTEPVHAKMLSILDKAGYEVIYPEGLDGLCCGMMFNSRGFCATASRKADEALASLARASENGALPVLVDTSPCLVTFKGEPSGASMRFALYEPVEFIERFLLDKLEFEKVRDKVAIHATCSNKKMGQQAGLLRVAGMCAHEVVDSNVPCCGTAGDRSMRFPELAGASLTHLNLGGCDAGFSTSRTCEMSLGNASKVPWKGIVYLVDEATKAKRPSA